MLQLARNILQRLAPRRSQPRNGDPAALARVLADELLDHPGDRVHLAAAAAVPAHAPFGPPLTDALLETDPAAADPDAAFNRLRWGGQMVFVARDARAVAAVHDRFATRPEFRIDAAPRPVAAARGILARGTPLAFVARKTLLTRPHTDTDRYSYDVRLVPCADPADGYAVLKQVPTVESVAERLTSRYPHRPEAEVLRGARKLVHKVFPLFLTREAALLTLLQRDLPADYRRRFPRVRRIDRDGRGLVQRLELEWLRLGIPGGLPLSQVEFARQGLELLHVLHETAGIIHLDLRLDNLSITPRGVSFLDFGSAVRIGEDLSKNPMLSTLFHEMLSTSQIQRDLKRLVQKGRITSRHFTGCCHRIDKAADLFYMVLQMNKPHANPDFRGLVRYDRDGADAAALAALSRRVFQPRSPEADRFRTAADVLAALPAA